MINEGIIHLNPAPIGERAMVVITGVGRSRTSMTARILQDAGLHIGEKLDDVVFEDHEMAAHINSGDPAELDEAIMHRNRCRPRWGFKMPGLHSNPHWPHIIFPHMRTIVMMRDPVAISVGHGIAHGVDPAHEVRRMVADVSASVEHALAIGCPTLLVSCEKAVTSPDSFLRAILPFCGIAPTQAAIWRGQSLIDLRREQYTRNARAV